MLGQPGGKALVVLISQVTEQFIVAFDGAVMLLVGAFGDIVTSVVSVLGPAEMAVALKEYSVDSAWRLYNEFLLKSRLWGLLR
ncbi:MAG: hypothetical protein QXQ91_03525 [Nanopusillaceae archaeon]